LNIFLVTLIFIKIWFFLIGEELLGSESMGRFGVLGERLLFGVYILVGVWGVDDVGSHIKRLNL